MCYPPSGHIIFSLRKLKSYGSWGPMARCEGRGQGPDNPNTLYLMYCFSFFRNELWQYLISYNSFRNMNMCLLEVAMCEKCRSSHFQLEGGVKSLRTGEGLKNFRTRWVTFAGSGQCRITCHGTPSYFKKTKLISI